MLRNISRFFGSSNRGGILSRLTDAIGNTPLVRLAKIPKSEGISCDIVVKCEFMNPGGSMKDRIAKTMIEKAEEEGLIKPGYTLIEPSSGNTAIALAFNAACKGYKLVITMPEHMSKEKFTMLEAMGAKVYKTPKEAGYTHPDNQYLLAEKLNREIPNSYILNQYENPNNPHVCRFLNLGSLSWNRTGDI